MATCCHLVAMCVRARAHVSATVTSDSLQPSGLCACVCVCVCVCLLQSHLTLCNPLDCSPPSSSVHGISKQAYWSRLPCSPPRNVPNPGIKPVSHMSSALAGGFFTISATWEALMAMHLLIKSSKKKANP